MNSESTLDDAAERAAAREEAKRFIAVVYGDPAAIAAWATLPDGGGSSPLGPQRFFGRLDDVFDRLWEARRAGHGVFTTLNLTDGQGFKSEHIVRVRFVWADEDEKDGRLPVDASALVPPPTMVIRSGGGRHIYWAVDDARLEEFTRAQKGIAASLVTDPRVSDLARVMRCPGFPHQKDRANPKRVFIEQASGRHYTLREVMDGLGLDLETVDSASIQAHGRLLLSREERIRRARAYLATIRAVQGEGGDLQTFKACAALLWDFGLDLETAWQLIREWNGTYALPPWDERELRKKLEGALRHGKHQLDSAFAGSRSGGRDSSACVPIEVAELNTEWFVLDEGGKLFVCRFVEDRFPHNQRRRKIVRYSFQDFRRKHEIIRIGDEAVGEAWLEWPGRRQYDRAVFDPAGTTDDPAVLNLWDGWPIEPKPGDWSRIRRHIDEVVCAGNNEHAEYLIKWIARLFQVPSEPGLVVPVLRGKEGVGKSVLGLVIRRALGQHGLAVSNPHHVVGNFNAHLRDLLFLEASEAFFAGDKAQANHLKALITDDMLMIEQKGVDAISVPNMLHVFMTTNEGWAISAGPESRRYFVLDVSDAQRNNSAYFSALFSEVNDDRAIGGMLHDLMVLDLSAFNVRRVPVTEALLDQRERSLTGVLAWALDLAAREEVEAPLGNTRWRPFFTTQELYSDFGTWTKRQRFERGMSVESFGRALKTELRLEPKRSCPRAVAGELQPDQREKPGYYVGTVEEFRASARRAAGLVDGRSGLAA